MAPPFCEQLLAVLSQLATPTLTFPGICNQQAFVKRCALLQGLEFFDVLLVDPFSDMSSSTNESQVTFVTVADALDGHM